MRIKSSFHDYYDSVQSHGQDSGMVYIREPKEETLGEKWPFPWILPLSHRDMGLKNHVIGFCGRVYPVLQLYTFGVGGAEAYCYTLEEVDAFFNTHLKKKDLDIYNETKRTYRYFSSPRRRCFIEYFDKVEKEVKNHTTRFEANLSPVFVSSFVGRAYKGYAYSGNGVIPDRADPGQKIVWNGSLREFDFMRIKDPYTAYQEITMFMGNMAFPNKPIPKMKDEDMAEIKGFNKYSFRKDPQK